MALSARNRAASLAVQPALIFVAPTTPDYQTAQTINLDFASITAESNEYTGNIHRPGPEVIGERVTLTLRWLLRSPGGVAPPAAGAFIPGRALVSAGFTELLTTTAIPAAPEAVSAGTTTQATLGAGAAATVDLYNGMAINLGAPSYPGSLSVIKDYTAAKVATFPETFGAALTGNYQIPVQAGYILSSATPSQKMMSRVHFDSVSYDLYNMVPTQVVMGFPTASRDAQEFSYIEVTYDAEIADWGAVAAPTLASLGSPPMYRCGDQWVANKQLGGTGFTITIDFTTERPANPNTCNGDPAQMTESRRSVALNLNHNSKATIDLRDMALVTKGYHSLWGQFGYTSGGIVSVLIPEARFDVPNVTENGSFVGQSINMLIDGADKAIAIAFPY
jgi:hypothetical protein